MFKRKMLVALAVCGALCGPLDGANGAGKLGQTREPGSRADRIPLPTDPFVEVYVGFAGPYRSLVNGETRPLQLGAELTLLTLPQSEEEEEEEEDTFAFLEVPPDEGWSFFAPAGPPLELILEIRDDRKRLGMALVRAVRDEELAEVVGRIPAEGRGDRLSGRLRVEAEVTEYFIAVFSARGELLHQWIASTPRSLDLEVWVVHQGFQPYRPVPEPDAPPCDAMSGPVGDPASVEGCPLLASPGQAQACFTRSFVNETSSQSTLPSPSMELGWRVIQDGTLTWQQRMKQLLPPVYAREATRIGGEYANFNEAFLGPRYEHCRELSAPPYTRGVAHREVGFTGHVLSLIALPAEWLRYNENWAEDIQSLVQEALRPGPRPAEEIARAIQHQLAERERTGRRGELRPGDILPLGDRWILVTNLAKQYVEPQALTQKVTFRLRSDHVCPRCHPDLTEKTAPVAGQVWVFSGYSAQPTAELTVAPTGEASVELPLGANYRAGARPAEEGYDLSRSLAGVEGVVAGTAEFSLPDPKLGPVEFVCHRNSLRELRLYPVDGQGKPLLEPLEIEWMGRGRRETTRVENPDAPVETQRAVAVFKNVPLIDLGVLGLTVRRGGQKLWQQTLSGEDLGLDPAGAECVQELTVRVPTGPGEKGP